MIPDFDISSFVNNDTPPSYRRPKYLSNSKGLLYGLTWLLNKFTKYKEGDAAPAYNAATTYAYGNAVKYNYQTYESLIDGNTGNTPSTSPEAWTIRAVSFIGADERVKYNGQYLYLTYELNRYFNTTFRQPPYPAPYDFGLGGGAFSDIYITNETPEYVSFAFSESSQSLGGVSSISMTNGLATASIIGTASAYKFIIHIPTAVYSAINATPAIADTIIRKFVDSLMPVGLQYSIVTY